MYLYSRAEIGQWNITSRDTVTALLAPDVALDNQTEVRAAGGWWGAYRPSPTDAAPSPGCAAEVPGP